jgi:DNA repair photolyase
MRIQAGLKPEDWRHWGEETTFKSNAAPLAAKTMRGSQIIYCSPLTDPYQPAEESERLMPGVLEAVASNPPHVFVIQTRGPLILRDLPLLIKAASKTRLRVSFSITTDREDVRRIFEPHCASLSERWCTVETLQRAGIETSVSISPILPCDPEALIAQSVRLSRGPIVCDPFHVREVKRSGATTREAAVKICAHYGWQSWLDAAFQQSILARMAATALTSGRAFGYGPAGFSLLTR